jgi:hypothetical protein
MYKDIKTVDAVFAAHPDKLNLQKAKDLLAYLPEKISSGMLALMVLQAACFVVNNDNPKEAEWKPDYNNKDQEKWFPWYRGGDSTGSGFRFSGADCGWAGTATSGGARLALKDEERAEHMNEFFSDWYKELYLMLD